MNSILRWLPARGTAVAVALLCLVAFEGTALAGFDYDNQLWVTLGGRGPLSPRVELLGNGELRLGGDVSEAVYFHGEAELKVRVLDILFAGVQYRQVFAFDSLSFDAAGGSVKAWDTEFQPGCFVQLTLSPRNLFFQEKLRLEVPVVETGTHVRLRARNSLRLGWVYPGGGRRSVMPYLEAGQLLTLAPGWEYRENRVSIGIVIPLRSVATLDVFYLWQRALRGGAYYDFFVLGVSIEMKMQKVKG